MDDLISRQAAIDFIDAGRLCNPNEPRWSDNEIVNFLKSRPSAQPGWIPCSERLPSYGRTVLITNDKGNVSYGRFRGVSFWREDGNSFWNWKKNTIEHVLAWMPLPEPYKENKA